MYSLERHDLAHLNRAGRERIFAELLAKGVDERLIGEMLLPERFPNEVGIAAPIPGIVRREEFAPREGFVPVGFASWRSGENGRLRIASFAKPEEIASVADPETVVAKTPERDARTPALKALQRLWKTWGFPNLRLGVWGSAALELETGHLYTHDLSDLDVRISPSASVDKTILQQCLDVIFAAEKNFGVRIDAELRLSGGYGAALKELLNEGATVLAKGREDVTLFQKTDVFASLVA